LNIRLKNYVHISYSYNRMKLKFELGGEGVENIYL
jgi:hypothetical protein